MSRFFLSTDRVPERERAPFFREEVSKLINLEVAPLSRQSPRYTMDLFSAGVVRIGEMQTSPTRFARTRSHLHDSDDSFTLVLLDSGSQHFTHAGHETVVAAGGFYFINHAIPNETVFTEPSSTVRAIRVGGNALRALVRHPEQAAGRPASVVSGPSLALLKGYMQAFRSARDGLSPDVVQSFGLHIVDLLAAIIGPTGDGAALAEAGGLRAARLREVLSAIERNAADPDFGADAVAAQLAVTTRYVNRLLEETGRTFSEHVNEHRLRRAWRLLSDPQCTLKIATVAFDCGFNQPGFPPPLRRDADIGTRQHPGSGSGACTHYVRLQRPGSHDRSLGHSADPEIRGSGRRLTPVPGPSVRRFVTAFQNALVRPRGEGGPGPMKCADL